MDLLLDHNNIGDLFQDISWKLQEFEDKHGIIYNSEQRNSKPFIQKEETAFYRQEFFELPIDLITAQKFVSISHSFYEMDTWGKEFYDSSIPRLRQEALEVIEAQANESDNRVNYIWCKLSEKYQNITEQNYPQCLDTIRKRLGLGPETQEETIALNLVKHYRSVLQRTDVQLKVFEGIILTKELADLYAQIWLEFFESRLKILNPDYVITNSEPRTEKELQRETVYELPENFSLTTEKIKADQVLDIKQTALLFFLLRKHKATINYSDRSLAQIVHYLTGHSKDNLRTHKGFGQIWNIMKETRQDTANYNLKKLRGFLQGMIQEIDELEQKNQSQPQ